MKNNIVTLLIFIVFAFPLISGFLFKYSSYNVKRDISNIESDIAFIAGLIFGIVVGRKIFIQHDSGVYQSIYNLFPQEIMNSIQHSLIIYYVVILPILIFLLFKIIYFILITLSEFLIFPLLDGIERFFKNKSEIFKRLLGIIFQLPRAISYVLILIFVINIYSMFNKNEDLNRAIQDSRLYNSLCKQIVIPVTKSSLAKKLPDIINNSFRVVIKNNGDSGTNLKNLPSGDEGKQIVYYNGVTLDEGVKSNSSINNFAVRLSSNEKSARDKAETLYNWVGKNIDYDYDKANAIMNNDFNNTSGAIPTFETRKGICFDYACLYTAMCRANGLHVRLITGQGFNGVGWVGHAWNQVYIPEENKWINVDTTFYKGGNYFDSYRFSMDHKDSKIAGEW